MTKSIETIWKEGFLDQSAFCAPKVNDLYNRKSQNIVDKLHSMFAININSIVIGSLVSLLVMSLLGAPFLGVYICLLLTPLIIIAKQEMKKSVDLNKGQSSYDYLVTFQTWLNKSIERYSSYYKMFYPLLFIGMATQAIVSDAGGKFIALLLQWLPTNIIILGQPFYILLAVVLITFLMAKFAKTIYLWDLDLVYGRQFKKLRELINDMEELRN